MKKAYGFIEMIGLASAVVAVDTALKAANVELDGLEPAKGAGMHTLKISGEVSSVKAAVSSILGEKSLEGKVFAHTVIARPSDGLEKLIDGKDDLVNKNRKKAESFKAPEDASENTGTEDSGEEGEPGGSEESEAGEEEESGNSEESEASSLKPDENVPDQSQELETSGSGESHPEEDAIEAEALSQEVNEESAVEAQKPEEEDRVPGEPGPSSTGEIDAPMEESPQNEETKENQKGKNRRIKSATCNLCLDPKCTRIKGEPHAKCLHYKEKE